MHPILIVLLVLISLVIYAAISFVCGRVTSELIHEKNPKLNEVMWFWIGVIFWWVGILLTLVVKKEDKE